MTITKTERKQKYFEKLIYYVQNYPKILIVEADFVGSLQMAEIRKSLRGKAFILMGKNTMIKRVLRDHMETYPELEALLPLVKLNIGLVFCVDEPMSVKELITKNKQPAPAKTGVYAPCDVFIPAGPTGIDPKETAFFQAVGIGTQIVKGQIEIMREVHLIKTDDKVSPTQADMCRIMNITPFAYGLKPKCVYDAGVVYDAKVLDMKEEDLLSKFSKAVSNVAAVSRAAHLPTKVSVQHSLLEAYKNVVGLSLAADYTFERMKAIKEAVENPDAFVAAAPVAVAAAVATSAKVAEPVVEEEEEDEEFGFDLFG